MEQILKKIAQRTGIDLVSVLAGKISGTELNSLLLEVFEQRAARLTAPELLKLYEQNRFVQPSDMDLIRLKGQELAALELLQQNGFKPLALSPVSPLGACSVVGPVSQKKIISASRGTEVLSDATNAIALFIAHQKQRGALDEQTVRYCTTHRHIRTPPVAMKGFTPHFTIACCVSAGKDAGNFGFEVTAIMDHFGIMQKLLRTVFDRDVKYFRLQPRDGYPGKGQLIEAIFEAANKSFPVSIEENPADNNYYHGIQYKAIIEIQGEEIPIADGGLVNWTQELLQNRKERFFISGFGLEYLTRITQSPS